MNLTFQLQLSAAWRHHSPRAVLATGLVAVLGLWLANCESVCAEPANVAQDGLVLWLDASDYDGRQGEKHRLRDSPWPLAHWSDLSGQGNHLSQDDSIHQPHWVGIGIGGKPSVRFQGEALLERDLFSGLSIGDQTFHIVIVFQAPRGESDSQRLLDLSSLADRNSQPEQRRGFWIGLESDRHIPQFAIHDGDQGEALSEAWDGRPHLLEVVYNGEQLFEIHVDGRTEQQAMFNGTHFLGFRRRIAVALGQRFGRQENPEAWFHGDVSEVLIYRRPLTAPERVALGGHLSDKYSLDTNFETLPEFERDIQPILANHCLECHNADTREAGLDLRTVSSMLRGGQAGPVIVRGHPEHSELFAMVDSGKMPPPDLPQLSAGEIDLIRRWIQADAPSGESVIIAEPAAVVTDEDREHWAWQLPVDHHPPDVRQIHRVRNDIDRFVLARLEAAELGFSPDATPEQRLRRIYFDLIGLPPAPSEADAFLQDAGPRRWERLVDQLLLSPHFGERWGRHWLDVAGHVDVNGSDNDAAIIKPLPGKWRYRDFVIESFNDDKPVNQFLVEQLAGDELYDWNHADSFTQPMLDALTATTFLLSANDDTDQNELNTPDVRHHVLQRVSENVANTLFAVTLQCARCHDHKYEAISQLDYYRFESVFAPVFNVRNWVTSDARTRPDVSDAERQVIDRHNSELDAEISLLEQRRNDIRNTHRQRLLETRLTSIPRADRGAVQEAAATVAEKRSDRQKQLLEKYQSRLTVEDTEIDAALSAEEQLELSEISTRVSELESGRRSYESIAIATETPVTVATHVLRRGNYLRPGLEVSPALPEILAPESAKTTLTTDSPAGLSGRRLALARCVTDADSLAGSHVARVFVNRVWQQVFGRGIVATSGNFGVSGAAPSHPKLLDWLTLRFIESGWRVKPLIRLLVLSTAYQQSSAGEISEIDPENALLWRMNLRQLDSEQLRDAILAVSGKLDRQLGGPPIPLDPRADGMVVLKTDALPPGTTPWRRSVYLLSRRNYHLTFMRVFDQPIVARNCSARKPTAVVTQSLALLHDDFMFEQSEILADRVIRQAPGESPDDRVRTAWRLVLGRLPDATEHRVCCDLLEQHTAYYSEIERQPGRQALVQLCHMLLNTSEFLYVQ